YQRLFSCDDTGCQHAFPLSIVSRLLLYVAHWQKTWRNSGEVVTKLGLFYSWICACSGMLRWVGTETLGRRPGGCLRTPGLQMRWVLRGLEFSSRGADIVIEAGQRVR